ncbi:MAG: hypothetical protein E7170_00655 [Firmicutes bacterium]|nr:hypothetical protein [Bacillota bacterium]
MKKLVLIMCLLLLTGCSIVRIDTNDIDNIVNIILSKNNNLFNQIGRGYKYYVPYGVSYIDTTEYNDTLYSNGDYYYLYIDIVSYYYNKENKYVIDENAYYSKIFDINDKQAYLQINETDDKKYLIQFSYNYSKIEVICDYEDINNSILNSSYILSTVKFNNNVIKTILDEEFLVNEEKYDVFESKNETDDFLKLEEEVE